MVSDTDVPANLRPPTSQYINGEWIDNGDRDTIEVVDPATEAAIAAIPVATTADVAAALAAAAAGFASWRRTGAWERSATLRRIADIIRADVDRFAEVMTAETGKPLAQSRGEVLSSVDQFDWYADEARRIYGRTVDGHSTDMRITVRREPVGPVAAFAAWNFPSLLPARKIAPALAAGCSLVVVPPVEAPLSALLLAEAADLAGLPAGVLNMVTGAPAPICVQLLDSPIIRKVSLTGSVPVGVAINVAAAKTLKSVSMELGGHAPVLVFADADPAAAGRAAAQGKFRNAGQVCIAASRFIVHESIAAEFTAAFVAEARRLRIGPGRDPSNDMGPLVSAKRRAAVEDLVEDAVAKGSTLACGGGRPAELPVGYYFAPTVLTDVTPQMRVMREEPFGPIAPISTFATYDEAIAAANATQFGLAAFVYTRDLGIAYRAAEDLEAGMVGVNHLTVATAEAPFGGVKDSGFGREGGTEGVEDYTYAKYVNVLLPGPQQ